MPPRNLNCLFISIVCLICFQCTKDENSDFYKTACFNIKDITDDNPVYTDSTVVFMNCSDSLRVTYLWDFGDGVSSTERAPKHKYSHPGDYVVKLTLFVNQLQTDTATQYIKVILGEKYFDFSTAASGIDFVEGLDKSIYLFGYVAEGLDFRLFLAKYDPDLHIKWIKYLKKVSYFTFINMEISPDGNIIIAGGIDHTINDNHYTVTKIDTSGNVIWNKQYAQTSGRCIYLTNAIDGGFLLLGMEKYDTSGNQIEVASIVKTDESGNYQWKRDFFKEWLLFPKKIVPVSDGYLFAASRSLSSGIVNGTDTLILTKIKPTGDIQWQSKTKWERSFGAGIFTSLAVNNSKILAYNEMQGEFVVYDLNGNIVSRNFISNYKNLFIIPVANQSYIACTGDFSWEPIDLAGVDSYFNVTWSHPVGKRYKMCSPNMGYGITAKPLSDGNYLFLCLSYQDCSNFNMSSILFFKMNSLGQLQ